MTYTATIHFQETQKDDPHFLILQLNASGPDVAHQLIKQRWRKIKKQLPNITAPRLMQLSEVSPRCPRCGATELSFCHH